jgi:HTH-type transcriptional regulator/antitoxin HipB
MIICIEDSQSGTFLTFSGDRKKNIPVQEHKMRYNSAQLGEEIRRVRKRLNVTQRDLALTSGTGLRFIIELEKGKPTCQLGKVLNVLNTLGIDLQLQPPAIELELQLAEG